MSGYDSVTTREKTHVVLLARHREQRLDPKELGIIPLTQGFR